MNIRKTIKINKSADEVWNVLGKDFANAHVWMSFVPNSHAKDYETKEEEAPVCGRVCELSDKPNGLYLDEHITNYSNAKREMTVIVTPQNAPKILPMTKNVLDLKVNAIDTNTAEVVWETSPQIKSWAYLIYPLFKLGMSKAFKDLLEELKYYVETGNPHPRKIKKMKMAAA